MIKDKYPNIKPSLNLDFANTKALDPRVSFRRGTPGAYYDGKTHVKAEENLIANSTVWSDSFPWDGTAASNNNSGWNFVNMTVHDNQPSPDGTNTAYKLSPTDSTTTATIWPGVSKSTEAQTFSIYVKMDSPDYTAVALYWNSSGTTHARFNLLTGQVTLDQGSGRIEASMHDVGNGWWRCVATHSEYSSTNATMYVLVDDTSATDFARWSETDGPDGVKGLLAWHPQIETRDFVTPYTPTNGKPVTKYQPQLMFASADQPRFDHDVLTGEGKGLLIEEQRTNLVTYSEDFSQWDRLFNVTVTSNTVVAPDGTWTGDLIKPSTSAEEVFVGQESFGAPSSLYSTTFYVKYAGIQWIGLLEASGFGFVYFDILNGVVGDNRHDGIGTITSIGNGWFRCSVFRNTATTSRFVRIFLCDANGSNYCTASDTKGIYVWGAQLETGSFPTSYIKTSGASATRSADNASITGENFSSWYRQDEGSIYSEVNTLASSSYSRISMSDGTSSNRIFISNGIYPLYINKNGDIQVRESSGAIVNVYSKRAAGLKKNDFALSIDGDDPLVDTSGDLPLVDRLAFSTSHASDNYVNGHIKKLSYYPQRLTNEQLQNLTR